MIRVTNILAGIDKSLGFEWVTERINSDQYELSFILINPHPSYMAKFLKNRGTKCVEIICQGRKDYIKTCFEVFKTLRQWQVDVIHTHLLDANLLGLFSGLLLRIPKRLHTRHHSTFHHEYFPKSVKYDRLINFLSTDIVAISENVKTLLTQKESVDPNKIHLVHHGFDLEAFRQVSPQDTASLKMLYNPEHKRPVIGVISRYMHWKGVQYIVPAFAKLLESYPNALLVLANAGKGDYKDEIKALLSKLPEKSFVEIEFEHKLFVLYQLFDIFVHVPINPEVEAFGQIYVEALAAGIPAVFTLSGIAHEFIEHEHNALVVDHQDTGQIYDAITLILENQDLRERLVTKGWESVQSQFTVDLMIRRLESLYLQGQVGR